MSGIAKTLNNLTYTKETTEGGRIKLSIDVGKERFESAKKQVYDRLAPSVNVSGFRPGKAPENVVAAQLGPQLYEQTLGELLPECTLEVIQKEELMPLDQIEYKVEKVAEGMGASFSATFSVMPEIKIPDLKTLKVEKQEAKVDDKEVDSVIQRMFQEGKAAQKGGEKDANKIKQEESPDTTKPDDAWAKSLNVGVNSLDELKEKIRGEVKRQKEMVEQNKVIEEVISQIEEQSKFDIPKSLVEKEIENQENQYKQRVENLGMKLEDFLKSQKVTMDELKKGWEKEAKKRIKAEMVLMQIAKEYNVKVTDEEIDMQVNSIQDEKLKKQYSTPQAKQYIQSMLIKQKVVKKIFDELGIEINAGMPKGPQVGKQEKSKEKGKQK